MAEEKEKPEVKPEIKPVKAEQSGQGVKVTKGGISKYVDLSQVANYKANGWT